MSNTFLSGESEKSTKLYFKFQNTLCTVMIFNSIRAIKLFRQHLYNCKTKPRRFVFKNMFIYTNAIVLNGKNYISIRRIQFNENSVIVFPFECIFKDVCQKFIDNNTHRYNFS